MGGRRLKADYQDLGDIIVNMDYYHSRIKTEPDANGCLNWFGASHRQGYGMFGAIRKSDNKRIMTVTHRITARIKLGRSLTHDDFIIHSCSNMRCQNPDHLFVGDYYTKSANMVRNGRQGYYGGGRNSSQRKQNRNYKYTDEEIRWLRQASTSDIMDQYGVCQSRAATMRWSMRKGYKWLKDQDE